MRYLHTITREDVKRPVLKKTCSHCGHTKMYRLKEVLGCVMVQDIGKRVYISEQGILQVENQEQLEKRLNTTNQI